MKTVVIENNGRVVVCQQVDDETTEDSFHLIEGTCPDNDKGGNARLKWNGSGLEWVEVVTDEATEADYVEALGEMGVELNEEV